MSKFTHLHVHTQYSILDGAASVKKIIKKAKELRMEALAITDHGNLYGVLEFYNTAREEGIKPILGSEVYVARGSRFDKDRLQPGGDHLVLLAKNAKGYSNLMKLSSLSFQREAYYSKPRVDEELLFEYSEGLICATACVAGLIPQLILNGDMNAAEKAINRYKDVFGEDFYLEIQNHGLPEENTVRAKLIELSRKLNVKLIATNDVHFVEKDDFEAHTVLVCLNTGKKLSDENKMMYTGQEYLKSEAEMEELFQEAPEAILNTQEVADKVEIYKMTRDPVLPIFDIPSDFGNIQEYYLKYPKETILNDIYEESLKKGEIAAEEKDYKEQKDLIERKLNEKGGYDKVVRTKFECAYLKYLTYEGAKKKYGEPLPENVEQRLSSELATIEWMGFPGYFLIVQDFINYSRETLNVIVGAGRGSAAGSVVAYCLGITTIEPLKYGLLFERFLNPDRISLPDIDVDFDDIGREQTLKYVRKKYGKDHVAQIVTFGSMAAKMAIKDVARVLELPLNESNRLAKLVSDKPGTKLEDAYKSEELKYELEHGNELVKRTLNLALKLEGSIRNTGVHACGVIIGPDDISKYVPVAKPTEKEENAFDNMMVSQFEGTLIESVGMIKMDFLGLKNLSIVKDACENIRKTHGERIDIDNIPLDDKQTLELYQRGDSIATFQFESDGMRSHLQNLKPDCFEDLIAMNALYRPGPMQYIPSFIKRKHGDEKIEYTFDIMEKYLAETYGITVYQEQVMQLSQALANFTPGQADKLRKAMGKKQKDVMEQLKDKFVKGCLSNGYDEQKVLKIWDDWGNFAEYAFNKSHATCYSYIAFQTGYLKAHYPGEYMSSVLTHNLKDISTISFYIEECLRQKINVLAPSVNESDLYFMVNKKGDILFGLAAIKGVGEKAAEEIIHSREKDGEFSSCFDFIQRVDQQIVNKRCIEALVKSGAFDCFGINRSQYFYCREGKDEQSFIEKLIRYGTKFKEIRDSSQASLFGENAEQTIENPTIPQCAEWEDLIKLAYEKEIIGFYISGHPLDAYKDILKQFTTNHVEDLSDLEALGKNEAIVAGIVQSVNKRFSKNNKPFCSFRFEDQTGTMEITLFGRDYLNYEKYLHEGYHIILKACAKPKWTADETQKKELELRITKMELIQELLPTYTTSISLTIKIEKMNNQLYDMIENAAKSSKGDVKINFLIIDTKNEVSLTLQSKKHLVNTENFLEKIQPLIGQELIESWKLNTKPL
ncbi:MAG: DNA polymerase III subunit alpha [Bacteroidales bacterium]|jgi:DNA polymerase-3 subunit alpha|nr:DNA polymerase III subunit alpha [Bacteroidales bacterium]